MWGSRTRVHKLVLGGCMTGQGLRAWIMGIVIYRYRVDQMKFASFDQYPELYDKEISPALFDRISNQV